MNDVLAQTEPKPFACHFAGCDASFDTPQGLSMHRVRVHTHRFGRRPSKTREQILQEKRDYNTRLRARNIAMGLTSGGKPRKMPLRKGVSPSNSKAYKRKKYLERVAEFKAQGLTAQGLVPARPLKGSMRGQALKNVRRAQQLRRERESMLNGAAPKPEPDTMGESARAIIVAAQVLRSVSVGLKL